MNLDIIMPCYYSNEVIRPAFDKIANQTVKDQITLIIVNDCSPNTNCEYKDIIEEYSKQIKIRYFKTPYHSGPGEARQLGLNHATSDLIMFQDDDDQLMDNNTIEVMLQAITTLDKFAFITGKICYWSIPRNIIEQWLIHPGSLQGSIFNRKLLQDLNITFEPTLSFKEEDDAFSTKVKFATKDLLQLQIDKCVYLRIYNDNHVSITGTINRINSIVYSIGLNIYRAKYLIDYNIQDKYLQLLYLRLLINNVPIMMNELIESAIQLNLKLSKVLYNHLILYIDEYFLILKYFDIDILDSNNKYLIFTAEQFYSTNRQFHCQYDENLIYNFKRDYKLYLYIIKNLYTEQ